VAQKKSRSTFEKLRREQAVKERRVKKQERKQAARLAKAAGADPTEAGLEGDSTPAVDDQNDQEPPVVPQF